jgi:hypothetical protein
VELKFIETSAEIDAITSGEKQIEDASDEVKMWFGMTAHNLALGIADAPEAEQADLVKEFKTTLPWWSPHVIPLAREIIRHRRKS